MTPAQQAIMVYDSAGEELEVEAHSEKARGKPLTARKVALRALVAYRAARAEFRDPPVSRAPSCACVSCWAYRLIPDKPPHPSELPVDERRARREP